MDVSIYRQVPARAGHRRQQTNHRLWRNVHLYLNNPVPLAALMRNPWRVLCASPPDRVHRPSAATVLPWRPRTRPTHRNHEE